MYVCLQHNVPNRDADSLHLSFLLTLLGEQWKANHMWKLNHSLPFKDDPYKM